MAGKPSTGVGYLPHQGAGGLSLFAAISPELPTPLGRLIDSPSIVHPRQQAVLLLSFPTASPSPTTTDGPELGQSRHAAASGTDIDRHGACGPSFTSDVLAGDPNSLTTDVPWCASCMSHSRPFRLVTTGVPRTPATGILRYHGRALASLCGEGDRLGSKCYRNRHITVLN